LKEVIANIAFVMELYLRQCLDFKRIHLIMVALMDKNEEWSWTTLCDTLTRYGQSLESTQETFIQEYFDRIRLRCQVKPQCDTEVRIQTVLAQVMGLRENAWQRKKRTAPQILKSLGKEGYPTSTNTDFGKSYASSVKMNFINNSKKRLHIIANDERKAQTVVKRAVKAKDTESIPTTNNIFESLSANSSNTLDKNED